MLLNESQNTSEKEAELRLPEFCSLYISQDYLKREIVYACVCK